MQFVVLFMFSVSVLICSLGILTINENGMVKTPTIIVESMCAQPLSCIWLIVTPCTIACQLLCPYNFPGKNTRADCHFLLQGIFPIQGSNLHLLHLLHWQIFYHFSHLKSPLLLNCMLACCCFSHVWVFVTLWTVTHQASLFIGVSRQEYWNELPCFPPGDLPNPKDWTVSPVSLAFQADSLSTELPGKSYFWLAYSIFLWFTSFASCFDSVFRCIFF